MECMVEQNGLNLPPDSAWNYLSELLIISKRSLYICPNLRIFPFDAVMLHIQTGYHNIICVSVPGGINFLTISVMKYKWNGFWRNKLLNLKRVSGLLRDWHMEKVYIGLEVVIIPGCSLKEVLLKAYLNIWHR